MSWARTSDSTFSSLFQGIKQEARMERTESEKPAFSHHLDAKWLSENPWGLDQLLKQVLEVIEADGGSVVNKVDAYNPGKPELIARLKELCNLPSMNHYDESVVKQAHLLQEPGSELDDQQLTPAQKSYSCEDNASPGSTDTSISFGGDGFTKNGTDSSSLSSDPETDPFDHSIGNPLSINGLGQHQMHDDFAAETPSIMTELEEGFDVTMKMNKYGTYKELVDIARNYEEELILVNRKLQLSEEENSRLKSELEKLEAADIQLQNHVSYSSQKNTMLKKELELAKVELDKSNEDKAEITLKYEAERSQVLELEKRVLGYKSDISMLHVTVSNLRAEISDVKEMFLSEKGQLLSDISSHLEMQKVLESTITEGNCKGKLLEEKLLRCESEKAALEELFGALERDKLCITDEFHISILEKDQQVEELNKDVNKLKLRNDMLVAEKVELNVQVKNLLRCESEKAALVDLFGASERDKLLITNHFQKALSEKDQQVQELNKDFDELKLKYDMLWAEKDELNAQIKNLLAQVSCRDDRIRQLEEDLRRSVEERERLMAASLCTQKIMDDLRFRVAELEREVGHQNTAILDGAEKKREAIRQLCFSLDHYMTEYQELRQAFSGRKRNLMVA